MNTSYIQLNVPINFNQLVDVVLQLPRKEKNKLQELLKQNEDVDEYDIPEEHKNIVRQRIKASEADPSRLLKWNEVKHKIKL